MKRTYITYISALGALCITIGMQADAYTDRLTRIINTVANEYDGARFDPDDMASAALQALNFVTVENSLSKNSPLGKKNKYITICAEKLQKEVIKFLQAIRDADTFLDEVDKKTKSTKITYDTILRTAWNIEINLKQIEGEIAEIPKKQLLPLTKVQKDLINLLELLVRKNIRKINNLIKNIQNAQ